MIQVNLLTYPMLEVGIGGRQCGVTCVLRLCMFLAILKVRIGPYIESVNWQFICLTESLHIERLGNMSSACR